MVMDYYFEDINQDAWNEVHNVGKVGQGIEEK